MIPASYRIMPGVRASRGGELARGSERVLRAALDRLLEIEKLR